MDFSDDLLQLMADSPRIAKHVHAPLQSGSDTVLRRMHRKYRPRHYEERIWKAREWMPEAAIGADVMVGFPGETAETIEQSFQCLRESPPDIYYLAPFNTRVEYVPILNDESRARFGIETETDGRSSAPYWRHDTMECTESTRGVESAARIRYARS